MPVGLYQEMMRLIEEGEQWPKPPRQSFIIEAVKEKIERWRAEHPTGPAPSELSVQLTKKR
jgi:hypothetical protein